MRLLEINCCKFFQGIAWYVTALGNYQFIKNLIRFFLRKCMAECIMEPFFIWLVRCISLKEIDDREIRFPEAPFQCKYTFGRYTIYTYPCNTFTKAQQFLYHQSA